MDRIMKEQLKKLYEAPEPAGKRAFFRSMELQPLSIRNILGMQFFYISKWEWVLSVLLIGGTVILDRLYEQNVLGMLLAMIPFLAVASVSDSVRSVTWGMSELEMSARFSLKSIVLARMVITGIVNIVLELFLAFLAGGDFCENILYLLVPYLVSAYGSLVLVRNIAGRDGVFACIGFGVLVGAAAGFSSLQFTWFYQTKYAGLWLMAVCFLVYLTYRESKRSIQKMEDIVWN